MFFENRDMKLMYEIEYLRKAIRTNPWITILTLTF